MSLNPGAKACTMQHNHVAPQTVQGYQDIMRETFTIIYKFTLPDNTEELFELVFDDQTVEIINNFKDTPPPWTELEHHQCPHCPLSPDDHPFCPVALNLTAAIDRFDHLMSFDKMIVNVISSERR